MPSKTSQKVRKETLGRTCRIPMAAGEAGEAVAPPMHELTWRIFRIMAEFVDGFQFLSDHKREVTIFGSARFKPTNRWYKEARKLGSLLADCGYTVTTGGGPGIMEGANRGASERGGESIGLNIQLPMEQRVNPYVKKGMAFHYFFTRKVMLAASAQAYVYFPGGFGTLDEFFEMVTLVQTGKMQPLPIVLVGRDHWGPLMDWVHATLRDKAKTVSAKDVELIQLVDTAEEALACIEGSEERTIF